MNVELSLAPAWRFINDLDWASGDFELEKAYVCALFSKLAYLHIPRYELEGRERVKVVPCDAYQRLVLSGVVFDVGDALRSADFGEFFVIERRYAVVVGVQTPKAVFVAIRGTKYLYDWPFNLKAWRHKLIRSETVFHVHRGFFSAMAACFEPLSKKLRQLAGNRLPIYVCGHSLGGAMSAVMHALWGMTVPSEFLQDGISHARVTTHSCYTFGMPRYGDFAAIALLREPHHLYNDDDIVPSVPPTWTGYASCLTEFRLDGVGIEKLHSRETRGFARWIGSLVSGSGIENHSMELYLERIEGHVSNGGA